MENILKYLFCLILALIVSFISWGILLGLAYIGISFINNEWLELTSWHFRFYITFPSITGLLFSFRFYQEFQ